MDKVAPNRVSPILMNLKILFTGGGKRGCDLLNILVDRNECVLRAFIMREDDHERSIYSDKLSRICEEESIPYKICKKIELEDEEVILAENPDVAFVCGWRTIIRKVVYQKIPYGCLAAHDSLLPQYRGFAPTAWAMINGEKKTGVTLFKIEDKGVDAGDIFASKEISIGEDDTYSDIYPQIAKKAVELYSEFLEASCRGSVQFIPQDESKATRAPKRTPDDGRIIWEKTNREVYNFIRALMPPYPYAWFEINSQRYFVASAGIDAGKDQFKPGEVIEVNKNGVKICCREGSILIDSIVDQNNKHINPAVIFKIIDQI